MGTHPIFESDFDCLTECRKMALFQQNASSSGGSKNLVEFKCGKMSLSGTTVTADKRKGLLYIYRDECTHFCWKDRTSGKIDTDLMIFPNDAEFVAVPQCTTGRVFLLKFNEGNKKLFFWMQEPDSKKDKDEELMKKVNEALNNPTSSAFREGRSGHGRNDDPEEALMQILSGGANSHQQIQQLQSLLQQTQRNQSRSGASSSSSSSKKKEKSDEAKTELPKPQTETAVSQPVAAASTSVASPATPSSGVQIEDLQSILRNMAGVMPGGVTPTTAQRTPIDIAEAMKAEDIIPMLANEQIREKLAAHLPEDSNIPKTEEELKETLRSPQFQQACDAFSHALSSGQLGAALKQFGVSKAAVDAANRGDVRAFADAMEKDAKRGEDDQMQTD